MSNSFNQFKEKVIKPVVLATLPLVIVSCNPSTQEVSNNYVKNPAVVGWNMATPYLIDDVTQDGRADVIFSKKDNFGSSPYVVTFYDSTQISKDELRNHFDYIANDVKAMDLPLAAAATREMQSEQRFKNSIDAFLERE